MSKFPHLFQAISTKSDGSMKDQGQFQFSNITAFLKRQHIDASRLILMDQVHGGDVATPSLVKGAGKISQLNIVPNVDGLITTEKNVFLGVVTADCLPLFFYDPKRYRVGVAHAGYKGLLGRVIQHTLAKFSLLGSNLQDVWMVIGPAIGVCCYDISRERIELFQQAFPSYSGWYKEKQGKYFLDMQKIATCISQEEGVSAARIAISPVCTHDQSDTFFSYRKDGKKAGRFMSVTGMLDEKESA